ncbi:hypothetical protein QR680_010054 [Steinernema hermaphroditum]|uniref:Uncharacterized protein n=1 Tax=Steinernema hermaphroditum TaxID=289476 RepID=A0AA39IMK4_9BILA|nr:hypothetical protein QR680_010054 [Steinernema hermaphroditum]
MKVKIAQWLIVFTLLVMAVNSKPFYWRHRHFNRKSHALRYKTRAAVLHRQAAVSTAIPPNVIRRSETLKRIGLPYPLIGLG